jgi:hypothetical protein
VQDKEEAKSFQVKSMLNPSPSTFILDFWKNLMSLFLKILVP